LLRLHQDVGEADTLPFELGEVVEIDIAASAERLFSS
jgi:hypothetical protein